MNKHLTLLLVAIATMGLKAQDTFSIVAVDTVTGEVGSAGASCVDLVGSGFSADLISELFPGVGAINCQAYYEPVNQANANSRMNQGDTPNQIIQWLVTNDVTNSPQLRQYGIAALVGGLPQADAFSGNQIDNYYNHIIGPNYAIQGNSLLGQSVLDSMEYYFLNTNGDLACKLMASLQAANIVGADTRCQVNGTSSLLAWIKVAQPSDTFGAPSIRVTVETADGAGIEPIDSVQAKFDLVHSCSAVGLNESPIKEESYLIFPNPTKDVLSISANSAIAKEHVVKIIDMAGKVVYESAFHLEHTLITDSFERGVYFLRITNDSQVFTARIIKN